MYRIDALPQLLNELTREPHGPAGRRTTMAPTVLHLLAELIPADCTVFIDMMARRRTVWAESDSDGYVADDAGCPDLVTNETFFDLYWSSECSYGDRSGDPETVSLSSDFGSFRQRRSTPMTAYLRTLGVPDSTTYLTLWLQAAPGHTRKVRWTRQGPPDFAEVDRAMAALFRPHLLAHLHALDLHNRGVGSLTGRQHQLLTLVADGYSNGQIARTLGISDATVRTHLQQTYQRLGVRSRTEAVATARPGRQTGASVLEAR